ncbi:sulfite exporter TauE/SafE family protein [Vibrio sp. EA2]|uniref:sulfite exporter TauE/SafE family protein n=1 Tax=Vibrio sp. EA2 TaxID=3079860 RepID=UPI002949D127|nr:sulfite exporter TauE/SafE family protein [Vibrio sp. EA2]MDV6251219.1 sulfite exporter TauE/SafE family protein [Vibrio sp. EA2]
MSVELFLGFISMITSAIAGMIGFGGGMLLIAILPNFVSPSLIIPVHGVTQLASNSSRMFFSLDHVKWSLLPKFLIGSLIGMLLFGFFLSNISFDYVPAAIGTYILLNLWSKRFAHFIRRYESYYLIGFLQTGLGLIVGAVGPLSLSVLTKQLKSNNEVIATSSMFLTISHLAKIPVYAAVTSDLLSNLNLIIYMVIGSILGSFIGTKARFKAGNDKVIWIIKVLLTLLAIRMLITVLG